MVTCRKRVPLASQAVAYEQTDQLPVTVVPHGVPEVLRAQAVVSVSVPTLGPQLPAAQVYEVLGRVRLPLGEQVEP